MKINSILREAFFRDLGRQKCHFGAHVGSILGSKGGQNRGPKKGAKTKTKKNELPGIWGRPGGMRGAPGEEEEGDKDAGLQDLRDRRLETGRKGDRSERGPVDG